MRFRPLLATAALLLLGTLQAATAQSPGAAERGRAVAERACAGCHAIGADQPANAQNAGPPFRVLAARPDQSAQRLHSLIMTPHRPMEGVPLSLAEVDDLVAFILTLR